MDSSTPLSALSAQTPQSSGENFILRFSPDEALAAVVRKEDKVITVVDLKSGIPRLTIDTGMEVYGLGVTGSSIVAADDRIIATWNLPTGDRIPNLRASITDSIRTATLEHDFRGTSWSVSVISVSPDLHHIAAAGARADYDTHMCSYLCLYDVPTGQLLGTVTQDYGFIHTPWFTPDGREVWCRRDRNEPDRWRIVEDSKSDVTELEYLGSTTHRSDGFPWQSSCGYQVMDGRWILGPSGKRLFWLPPQCGSYEWDRRWVRRFLALSHSELPEAVILELE